MEQTPDKVEVRVGQVWESLFTKKLYQVMRYRSASITYELYSKDGMGTRVNFYGPEIPQNFKLIKDI